MRHPAYALVWKDFDEKFLEFASDPRNVCLALATDDFNPFKTMNVGVCSTSWKDDFTNDDYSRVKGPEKRGYVHICSYWQN